MSVLEHDYDPVKRREYYLRTRKLRGRSTAGSRALPAIRRPVRKTPEQRRLELEARVNRLKTQLAQLQTILKTKTEAAQKRAGVEKNTAEKVTAERTERKPSADPVSKYERKTQSQKNAAAKAAEKYRDKNDQLADQVKSLTEKIKTIRERIKKQNKTGSVGASKSTTK